MADITAEQVRTLREATNVSMMECKRALVEAAGDMEKATRVLRERGIAIAGKKASRAANQGLIASASTDNERAFSLVEVNCETDFVARNTSFQAFVADVARKACATDAPLAGAMQKEITAKIAEMGENIQVRRQTRFVLAGNGKVASYIHLGGKVGVLIELGCEKETTPQSPVFQELIRDLVMHVAACVPRYLESKEVPADLLAVEREIYAKQVKDKPPQIVEKIVDGKIKKFYADICLVDQGFVKDPKQSVTARLAEKSKELGDSLKIRRFVRFQLGET